VLPADRQVCGHDLGAESLLQGTDGGFEIGALAIEHVAEEHPRQAAVGGALPEALRLDLDPKHRVDHHDGRLDHVQRGDRVGEEAGVARRVDEVEGESGAVDVGEGSGETELALLLILIPV